MKERSKGQVLATRARRAMHDGHPEEARKLAGRALAAGPEEPSVLRSLAELSATAGDMQGASDLLERAISRHRQPAPAAWQVRLAEMRVRQGRLDDAARTYRAALSAAPDDKAALAGLARVRHTLGDIRGAIEEWTRLLALDPQAWEPANDLGAAWMEINEWDRAAELFAKAGAHKPDKPIVLVNRATLDLRRGRRSEGLAAFQACAAKYPTYAPGVAGLGFALRDAGRFDEAAVALRRAGQLAPDDPVYACGLGRTLLEAGAAVEASTQAQAYLARRPGYSGAFALEALARLALGDADAVGRVLDYEAHVQAIRLPVPSGFADLAAFNAALAAHAASHPTLSSAPASHATARGLHSGSLLVEPRGPVAALEQGVGAAVTAYWRRFASSDPPFAAHRPQTVFLKMWCVVLEPGGHQIPHIHPGAWLSGVYYPQVPEPIRTGAGPGGWLEFGQPDREFPSKLPPHTLRVRPEEGLLVLFPSYFYHRTIPFDEPGTRISVAFDVVPV